MKQKIVIVGLGETGSPLYDLIAAHHDVLGMDLNFEKQNVTVGKGYFHDIDILHICLPCKNKESFTKIVLGYATNFCPRVVVINSTVPVGTCEYIRSKMQYHFVHSPVRGVHARMNRDLQRYTKFIGSDDTRDAMFVKEHFESIGLKTKICSSTKVTELMKLLETTYYGVLIAWAQETERIGKKFGCKYDEITSFWEEIHQNLGNRPIMEPGFIGGHCVIPNALLIKEMLQSDFVDAILHSNSQKERDLKEDN